METQIIGLFMAISYFNKDTTQLFKWLFAKADIKIEGNNAVILSYVCSVLTAWGIYLLGFMPNAHWIGVTGAGLLGGLISNGFYKASK